MVVRRRLRAVLIPLAAYAVAGCVVSYFLHNAEIGNRGLAAKQILKIKIHDIKGELESVQAESRDWERRLALLRSDQIDKDLLEERARILLGRVGKNDLVIVTP